MFSRLGKRKFRVRQTRLNFKANRLKDLFKVFLLPGVTLNEKTIDKNNNEFSQSSHSCSSLCTDTIRKRKSCPSSEQVWGENVIRGFVTTTIIIMILRPKPTQTWPRFRKLQNLPDATVASLIRISCFEIYPTQSNVWLNSHHCLPFTVACAYRNFNIDSTIFHFLELSKLLTSAMMATCNLNTPCLDRSMEILQHNFLSYFCKKFKLSIWRQVVPRGCFWN